MSSTALQDLKDRVERLRDQTAPSEEQTLQLSGVLAGIFGAAGALIFGGVSLGAGAAPGAIGGATLGAAIGSYIDESVALSVLGADDFDRGGKVNEINKFIHLGTKMLLSDLEQGFITEGDLEISDNPLGTPLLQWVKGAEQYLLGIYNPDFTFLPNDVSYDVIVDGNYIDAEDLDNVSRFVGQMAIYEYSNETTRLNSEARAVIRDKVILAIEKQQLDRIFGGSYVINYVLRNGS